MTHTHQTVRNVYALSDIHGCIDIYRQVKNFLGPEDLVLFLGDAGDRGPQSWECIQAIYNDPQFIYLMGNHEDMLCHSMRGSSDGLRTLVYNGGKSTFDSWAALEPEERTLWRDRLEHLPLIAFYQNRAGEIIYLSHSGYRDEYISNMRVEGTTLQLVYEVPFRTDDIIWDRYNLYDDRWHYGENEYTVHGHSPIPLSFLACDTREELEAWEPEILYYCEGHKIDIDCGTHYTGDACLLDLNTWDEHYFETTERAQ